MKYVLIDSKNKVIYHTLQGRLRESSCGKSLRKPNSYLTEIAKNYVLDGNITLYDVLNNNDNVDNNNNNDSNSPPTHRWSSVSGCPTNRRSPITDH